MQQIFDVVLTMPNGISRREIELATGLHQDNLRDILRALRLVGMVESTLGPRGVWRVAGGMVVDADGEVAEPLFTIRRVFRAAGTWKVGALQAQAWHP